MAYCSHQALYPNWSKHDSHHFRGNSTATESVIRYTPPSGFALRMGAAALINCTWCMTFVDQHYRGEQQDAVRTLSAVPYPIPRPSDHCRDLQTYLRIWSRPRLR